MYTLQVKQNIKIMGSGLMKSEIQNKAEKTAINEIKKLTKRLQQDQILKGI